MESGLHEFFRRMPEQVEISNLRKVYDAHPLRLLASSIREREDLYVLGGVRRGLKKRAGDRDIVSKNSFVMDFDLRDALFKEKGSYCDDASLLYEIERIRVHLDRHDYFREWSFIVFSGNGCHVHYFGNTLVVGQDVTPETYRAGVEHIYQEVSAYFNTSWIRPDTACANIGRTIRCPGSINHKNKDGRGNREVRILYSQDCESRLVGFIPEMGRRALDAQRNSHLSLTTQKPATVTSTNQNRSIVAESESLSEFLREHLPIEWELCEYFGCTFNGRNFFYPEGKPYAFFKANNGNYIVSGGSHHFPDKKGYGVIEAVMHLRGLTRNQAIAYFKARYPSLQPHFS